ncbi:hypothetical protein [Myxococcus xanthus]|uniref:hypothetical protein n=1 Tax=Myxococcus xanthus TaxID=34 RepID=UPI0011262730|nr:hypothetical protein [Myxococcus xanthus]
MTEAHRHDGEEPEEAPLSGDQASAAKAVLQAAANSSTPTPQVHWGVHQPVGRPDGATGQCKHFTLLFAPNDWHLYQNLDGSQCAYMSNGAGPAHLVTINRY